MPYPIITFNFDTGSDTLCSGAPATMAPINGLNAQVTSGSATINLSADNPDLTPVPTNNTAVIWIESADPNRNHFTIYDKNNTAKTVSVTPAPTFSGTFRWAIGGKRKSWDEAQSKRMFQFKGQVAIVTETDQTISSTIRIISDLGTADDIGWVGSEDKKARRVLTMTADAPAILCDSSYGGIIAGLHVKNSAATKTDALGIKTVGNGTIIQVLNCIFGDPTDKLSGNLLSANLICNCAFVHCVNHGVSDAGNSDLHPYFGCVFARNGGDGYFRSSSFNPRKFVNCLFYRNSGRGALLPDHQMSDIFGCTFCYNGSHGLEVNGGSQAPRICNSIFAFNGGYGLYRSNNAEYAVYYLRTGYNCFWNNASGSAYRYDLRYGDVVMDPQFVDPANDDFRIGENVKALGFPSHRVSEFGLGGVNPVPVTNPNMKTYVDIGAAQRQEPAGGGGAAFCPIVGAIF
jgi:hypothetical protein